MVYQQGLIQEGITQLQEGIVTFLCFKIGMSFEIGANRNLISSYLSVCFSKAQEQWEGELKKEENSEDIKRLDEFSNIKEISGIYDGLTKKRNDINHGGFTKYTPANNFIKVLKKYFDDVKNLLSIETNNAH